MKMLLKPFTAQETADYIIHRLHAAGATRAIFADDAELIRLKQLRNYKHGWLQKSKPVDLTIPTTRRR